MKRSAAGRSGCWASRWRNPEHDLPADFAENRDIHYDALRQPLDPTRFIDDTRTRHVQALDRLQAALADGTAGGVTVTTRRGEAWISVPHQPRQPDPAQLEALKDQIQEAWGTIDLLDVLKESTHRAGALDAFTTSATREVTDQGTLHRRLLLVLFGLGTNIGLKRISEATAATDTPETEAALRRVRRYYLSIDNLRAATTAVANATLAERDPRWWGQATACASDSKKFGSWASNFTTEWHNRYGGAGVMIYWHVERNVEERRFDPPDGDLVGRIRRVAAEGSRARVSVRRVGGCLVVVHPCSSLRCPLG